MHAHATRSKEKAAHKTPPQAVAITSTLAPPSTGFLQRKGCACGGGCPTCGSKAAGSLAALRVSEPGDAYEREADAMAARVMVTPAAAGAGESPPNAGAPSGPGDGPALRRVAAGARGAESTGRAGSLVRDALGSGGSPLSASARAFMEPRFGRDFGGVRVHTDVAAAESARAVGALAYTVGDDIVFGAGRYAPDTSSGRSLLAHELVHTLQQRGGERMLQRLPDSPSCSGRSLPISTSCGSFHNTCYSDAFTGRGGTSATITVNMSYDSDDCHFPEGREDFRVELYQCGWKDSSIRDFGVTNIGTVFSDSHTLPGAGTLLGNDNYYVRIYTRSQCSVTARIDVR